MQRPVADELSDLLTVASSSDRREARSGDLVWSRRAHVLVVEDEQLVAFDLATRLAAAGYAADTAASGEEAIEKVMVAPPDVILMDIKLSGEMDGTEVAEHIRSSLDVPIVYLTAFVDQATLDRARRSEPYGYIVKPFNPRELEATIEMALQRHGRHRQERAQQEVERFLAHAAARLSGSLDYETVLDRAIDLMVPRYADSCLICLGGGSAATAALSRYAGQKDDPERRPSIVPAGIIDMVLRDGRGRLNEAIEPASRRDLLGGEYLEVLDRSGLVPESLICVPFFARSQVLGALLLVTSRGGRRYGRLDLALVRDLAQRLSMAIDNALLYREAQQAIRSRDELLAVVSHDLRSPLTSILARSEAMVEGLPMADNARAIVRSAQRMRRLVDDLLDAAAIEAGRLSILRRRFAPVGLVGEAVEALRPLAEQKRIGLDATLSAVEAVVVGDPDRIVEVLENLIGNAIKFTPSGGSIAVRCEPDGAHVRISVCDTGCGIAPEHVSHLFDRFWRAEARRSGAGLGLYIAKGIVMAHGGDISVTSAVGTGSTFSITLPIASQDHAGGEPSDRGAEP
jgi:signal transduction histidine kinase/CheY-like chemotaxis protein